MVQRHLIRLVAPKSWIISRKGNKFVTRPNPGAHPLERCMPLNLLIKDMLKYAKKTREVKKILNAKKILVDNVPREDFKFGVGLMDVISIPETDEHFRLLLSKNGKFFMQNINKSDANIKPCKIIGKKILKKKKVQLNLFDSRNVLVDKDNYNVGDTVLYEFSSKMIKGLIKFEKGALIYIMHGKYGGNVAVLENVTNYYGSQPSTIKLKSKEGSEFETLKEYAFVIDNSIIKE